MVPPAVHDRGGFLPMLAPATMWSPPQPPLALLARVATASHRNRPRPEFTLVVQSSRPASAKRGVHEIFDRRRSERRRLFDALATGTDDQKPR